jgi:hypothetical protein
MTVDTAARIANPSGKFTIEPPSPISTPGSCGGCGTPRCEEGFVNTGLDFEFWGTLIFCRTCVTEMAAIYGLISAEQAEEYQLQTEEMRKEVEALKIALESAKGIIDGYSSNWLEHRSSSADIVPTTPVQAEPEISKPSNTVQFRLPEKQSDTSQSGSVEGLFNL